MSYEDNSSDELNDNTAYDTAHKKDNQSSSSSVLNQYDSNFVNKSVYAKKNAQRSADKLSESDSFEIDGASSVDEDDDLDAFMLKLDEMKTALSLEKIQGKGTISSDDSRSRHLSDSLCRLINLRQVLKSHSVMQCDINQ